MKKGNFFRWLMVIGLVVFMSAGCSSSGDDNDNDAEQALTPRAGSWEGDGVSFTVSGGSVNDFVCSYSGYATGTICSFNYKSTESFGYSTVIENNSFRYATGDVTVSATFTDDENAEIKVSWSKYSSECNADQSGTETYSAHYVSDTADPDPDIQALFESEKSDEVLDDWELYKEGGEPIDISTDGTVCHVSVGAEDYVPGEQQIAFIKKKFEGAIGMIATINVSETNTMGGPTVGIRGQIARNSDGNSVRIELRIDCGENGGMHGFYYQIKEKDDEGNTLRILKEDSLGEPDGMWSLGEDFTLGVLYMGSEIWCYTPYSIEKVYEIESPVSVGPEELGIFAWGQAWGKDFLYATVSNVQIIYPESSSDAADDTADDSQAPADAPSFEGKYTGTFSGGDYGTFTLTIDSQGDISGTAYSEKYEDAYSVSGEISSDGEMNMTAGSADTGATFKGSIDSSGTISGTWKNSYYGISGTFSGSKS